MLVCKHSRSRNSRQMRHEPQHQVLDKDGTARISRIVAVPKTLSPEAQAMLATGKSWCPDRAVQKPRNSSKEPRSFNPVKIEEDKMVGGVKTKFVTPASGVPANKKRPRPDQPAWARFTVGFRIYVESIPIANLTRHSSSAWTIAWRRRISFQRRSTTSLPSTRSC